MHAEDLQESRRVPIFKKTLRTPHRTAAGSAENMMFERTCPLQSLIGLGGTTMVGVRRAVAGIALAACCLVADASSPPVLQTIGVFF